jgi:hypothetical protein
MAAENAGLQALVPPEERFWLRYSPHHEFPLANVTSFVAHGLAFGLALLLVVAIGPGRNHQVPVEAVRLGGGGGQKTGNGDGPAGGRPPLEAAANLPDRNAEASPDDGRRLDLKATRSPEWTKDRNPDAKRAFEQPNLTPSLSAFRRLNDKVHAKFQPRGETPRGLDGDGSGGGKGPGAGPGTGGIGGPGKGGALTRRERRMQRWRMLFTVGNGAEYVRQLKGLGAILAIPVKESRDWCEYRIVRDLGRRPAQLLDEDITKIQQIYWHDIDPRSIAEVMTVLSLSIRPSHFVAFMPVELEDRLFEMEMKHAEGRPEKQIKETVFRVRQIGGRYQPEFESIRFKRPGEDSTESD